MDTPLGTPRSTVAAGVLALALLGGCATESDAPTTPPAPTETAGPGPPAETAQDPSSATPEAPADEADAALEEEAQALGVTYLESLAAGDDEAAFAMLSPESQEWYTDATGFATARTGDGSLTPDAAGDALTGTVRATAGPEDGVYVVTASSGTVAASFVVRDHGSETVVDDPGVPTTGPTAWEWQNPALGPDDARQPTPYVGSSAPTVLFTTVVDASGDVLVEPPSTAVGVVDGTEVDVMITADEDEGAVATVGEQLTARGQTVTIAWQSVPRSPMWHTSTVTLTP